MTTAGDLKTTELRLGLPGSDSPERPFKGHGSKRGFSDAIDGGGKWVLEVERKGADFGGGKGKDGVGDEKKGTESSGSAAKAQVVGWPPIRNYRKNTMAANTKGNADAEEKQELGCLYVKVSMDGAPYLRKVDLRTYTNYKELSTALMKMFSCFTIGPCGSQGISNKDGLSENRIRDMHGSMYVLIYEDRDGDWMLSGDVPWEMFTDSCRRLRIMKASDAIGLAERASGKGKSQK